VNGAAAAVVLDQVPDDADPWVTEKQWITEFADYGLLNKMGNPYRRCDGAESPSPAAA